MRKFVNIFLKFYSFLVFFVYVQELFDCSDFKISQLQPNKKDSCKKPGRNCYTVMGENCYDLPFTVSIGSPMNTPPRIRSGVEQCIQPSNLRDLKTVYQKSFHNFFETYESVETTSTMKLSLYKWSLGYVFVWSTESPKTT